MENISMKNGMEPIQIDQHAALTHLPKHISENLSSPLLRAAWLVELSSDLHLDAPQLLNKEGKDNANSNMSDEDTGETVADSHGSGAPPLWN